jgi:hypothetical protein
MSTGRLEQDALSSLLSVDDHASPRDDDVPSPRVAANAAASATHHKLRPWAARTAEANATAKIRASNLTQVIGAVMLLPCARAVAPHVTPSIYFR